MEVEVAGVLVVVVGREAEVWAWVGVVRERRERRVRSSVRIPEKLDGSAIAMRCGVMDCLVRWDGSKGVGDGVKIARFLFFPSFADIESNREMKTNIMNDITQTNEQTKTRMMFKMHNQSINQSIPSITQ